VPQICCVIGVNFSILDIIAAVSSALNILAKLNQFKVN